MWLMFISFLSWTVSIDRDAIMPEKITLGKHFVLLFFQSARRLLAAPVPRSPRITSLPNLERKNS